MVAADTTREGKKTPRSPGEHIPVMVSEVLSGLAVSAGGRYVDATLGMGGHTRAILDASAPNGVVVALDRDREAVEVTRRTLASYGQRLQVVCSPFSRISDVLSDLGWVFGEVDGVMADLGLSSRQLDDESRGFSFSSQGALDMRMSVSQGPSASQLLYELSAEELGHLFKKLGEEPLAMRFARAIKKSLAKRDAKLPVTPLELAQIIEATAGAKRCARSKKHPATKVFMALRIAVNKELEELEILLKEAPRWLKAGGRLAVISFHSLEDRMVKRCFRELSQPDQDLPPGIPLREADLPKADFCTVGGKSQVAGVSEREQNPRSRSARLRVLERMMG